MLEAIEEFFDSIKARLRRRYGIHRLQIVAYPGYRCDEHAFIRGRVLCGKDIERGANHHGAWRNFANMTKRFLSAEIPHARLEVRWNGHTRQITTDHEGFFRAELPMPEDADSDIRVRVIEPQVDRVVEVEAPIIPSTRDPNLVIVSDIDDTIILTWATKIWRMIRLTFFGNATTRKPFAGVAEWYRALQRGAGGDHNDPIFYVSSSPWNLYDFIEEFLDFNGIPSGPLFLRDHGLEGGSFHLADHHTHKLNAIQRLLGDYPNKSFVLIGDNGQRDPEIYRDLVTKHPGRMRGVCIRNVNPLRVLDMKRIERQINEAGVPFKLFDHSKNGWESTREWGLSQ